MPLRKADHRLSQSHRGATPIVSLCRQHEYPQLAAHKFSCLNVAEPYSREVPSFRLSQDALVLVIDHFDLWPGGNYQGFENSCVLTATRTDQKSGDS